MPRFPWLSRFMPACVLALMPGLTTLQAASPGNGLDDDAHLRDLPRDEALRAARHDLEALENQLRDRPDAPDVLWNQVRLLHALSVSEEERIEAGMKVCAKLYRMAETRADTALLQAYRGAFDVVRAKHALWPGHKMQHLKRGLPALDSAVQARPGQAEIRYLRLVSCYYLPFFLGRKWSVREDFAALARDLPALRETLPPKWFLGIGRFVLQRGSMTPEERQRLTESCMRAASLAREGEAG